MRKWLLPEYIEDILPAEARRIEALRRAMLNLFEVHGYQLVLPPLLEQVEIVTGTGKQRLPTLEQRRAHQLIAVALEQIEHRPPQRLDAARLGRQDVLDIFRQQPFTHGCSSGKEKQQHPGQHRGEADKTQLAIGLFSDAAEGFAPETGSQERQQPFDDQHQRQRGQQDFTHGDPSGSRPRRYLDGLLFLKYLKNSELGSSTNTSLLFLKLCRYASRLR